jgi:hypothetical protein
MHPVESVYDKTRQSRYLTRNYLFYVQTLYTSLYSQHVSAAMRHHQVKPNTTHQITSRYQTVIQFTIKPKHIFYKTIGYELKLKIKITILKVFKKLLKYICLCCENQYFNVFLTAMSHFSMYTSTVQVQGKQLYCITILY